jgi:hypothetical protein
VLGAIATPIIAGAYFVLYAGLVGLGADPTATPAEVWANGLVMGGTLGVAFIFAPQIWAWAMRESN